MIRASLFAATAILALAAPALAGPFDQPSPLPFQAPAFDRIRDADYLPAFKAGMAAALAEMRAIAADPAPPTFDNTIVAMEKSGAMLDRVQSAFSAVNGADTNPDRQAIQQAVAPLNARHNDAIYLDPKLFARVRSLHDKAGELGLDADRRQVLEVIYRRFVRAGAQLAPAAQARLREINGRFSVLQTAFSQKLLAGTKAGALVVDDPARLKGLSAAQVTAAAAAAAARGLPGKWLIALQNTTQQPDLQALEDRSTREALFDASWTRNEKGDANDTRDLIVQMALLRAEKARLLGYPNWAAYVLADQMAGSPQAALSFMDMLIPATAAEERREAAELQGVIKAEGGSFALKPWDWDHYAEKVRRAKFDLDEAQVKPYFELGTVLEKGVFFAATQLYGVTFRKRTDLPVWTPDVMVYEVSEADGTPLGLIYFDYFKRDNKNGGAWMSSLVRQSTLLGSRPVVYNVANLPRPAPGQPALISFDDVRTMFHEFGHALHGLFSNGVYPSITGTNTARDFVEFPSQFNEHWALEPRVLTNYAIHYRTGAPLPADLLAKIRKAAKFNQGYALGELIAAAELDMAWHALPAGAPRPDVDRFEADALAATGLDVADVPTRYRTSTFQHIWSNGYAAGYYAYLWTQMLENDAYAWFTRHGGMTRANGQRFRDMILSQGHRQDYAPMFRAFYGKDPDIGPMLEERGLKPASEIRPLG